MPDIAPVTAPTPTPSFLGTTPTTPTAPTTPTTPTTPVAPTTPTTPTTPTAPNTPAAYTSPFAAGLNPDGTYREGWTQQLADQGLTRLANRLVTFKNEGDALRSLDHALGLIGKRPEIGPPKAGAAEQDVIAYREAAGVPNDAKGYELDKVFKPEVIEGQGQAIGEFAQIMHEGHVPKEVAEKLAGKYSELIQGQHDAGLAKFEEYLGKSFTETDAIFQKEWGDEHAGRLQANKDYAATLGLDMNDKMVRAALSMPWVIRALDSSRRALRGALPGDGKETNLGGTHSARQQAQEIMAQNPGWKKDPALVQKVNQLYSLDAQASKRK